MQKHKLENDSIDYYGARNLIVSMLDFLGTKEENHMVEMIPGMAAPTISIEPSKPWIKNSLGNHDNRDWKNSFLGRFFKIRSMVILC